MRTMFQRQLGLPVNGMNRTGSSELLASPCAHSRASSRNNSFTRKAPAGGPCSLLRSRSKPSLLVSCSSQSGPFSEGSPNDASPSSEVQPQGHEELVDGRSPHLHRPAPEHPQPPSLPRREAPDSISASSHPFHPTDSSSLNPARNDQAWDSPEPFVPSPANLPTPEDGILYPPRSLLPLRKDIWTVTDRPGVDFFSAGPHTWNRLREVYVILFGVGQRDTQGIYSLRVFGADGVARETIIAFEGEEEAQRYACLLEASMTHTPHVCSIPPRELLIFCLESTYSCQLEPRGSLLIPPDINIADTDWERYLRLRGGNYAVLDAEPELLSAGAGAAAATAASESTAAAAGSGAGGSSPGQGAGVGVAAMGGGTGSSNLQLHGAHGPVGQQHPPAHLVRYSELAGSELDEVRARLEALMLH